MAADEIDVAYVAQLARIALSPEELERYKVQLGNLLDYVKQLEALPTGDVAATAQVIPSKNVARDDTVRQSLDRETVLAAAPQRQGAFFRVPRILGEGS